MRRFPDPFLICLVLTLIAMVSGVALLCHQGRGLGDAELVVMTAWYEGFWDQKLLHFAFQMCLIIVTGSGLARVAAVRACLGKLAGWAAHSNQRAAASIAVVAVASGVLSWGLSLVISAVFAREVIRLGGEMKSNGGRKLNAAVLASAAYMGLLVWHGGLTGSAPLEANKTGVLVNGAMAKVSLETTIFSWTNVGTAVMILAIPVGIVIAARRPVDENDPVPQTDDETLLAEADGVMKEIEASPDVEQASACARRFRIKLTRARNDGGLTCSTTGRCALTAVGLIGVATLVAMFMQHGSATFTLDWIIFALLLAGCLLMGGNLHEYQSAAGSVARDVGPLLLQFPFYWGIVGILRMEDGLIVQTIAGEMAVHLERINGLPLADEVFLGLTYVSSCILNVFVPSGGAQWFIQGPVVFETLSASGIEVPPGRVVMAFAFGDQTTNMIQPFWLLPVAAITRVSARDILAITAPFTLLAVFVYLSSLITCSLLGL